MKSDGERCLFVSFSIESYCEKMIILGGNIYAHFLLVAFYKIITNKFNRDKLVYDDGGLRIQIGSGKKKYFKKENIQKVPERLLKLL